MRNRLCKLLQAGGSRAVSMMRRMSRGIKLLKPSQLTVELIWTDRSASGGGQSHGINCGFVPTCIPRTDFTLLAVILTTATTASANFHARSASPHLISGVAFTGKCPRPHPCSARNWTVSTVVGLGTRTITVTAIYAGGDAGFRLSISSCTAPPSATCGSYPSCLSTPTRGSDDGADTFTLNTAHVDGLSGKWAPVRSRRQL
jgi:hypothetical protein